MFLTRFRGLTFDAEGSGILVAVFVLSDGLFLLEIFVLQQEFGGFWVGNGVFLLGIGGFVLERPVFLLSDGFFLLPVAVACRKSAFSGTKTGGASRESQRSCSRAAISITFLEMFDTGAGGGDARPR